MTNGTSTWSEELQSALLTAENHGDAYRLLSHPDACRAELRKVIANHHPEVNDMEQESIAQVVLLQWLSDQAASAAASIPTLLSVPVNQLSTIATDCGLVPTNYDVLTDGTISIRFGEEGCPVDFNRYVSVTIDDEGADIDIGGFIGDCRAGAQIEGLNPNSLLPRQFTIAAEHILKD